ncbi:IS3 family transposase [Mesorhizobium sp. M0323]|uniref:IS3 family transposase n=1 Tax=Mesorhizobium sp. M0323 TaxID=2956938 RepID=UPI00333D77A7
MDGLAHRDIDDATTRIGEFIEVVYNRQRLHSALNYLSPDAYETGVMQLRQKTPNAIHNKENCC